MVTQAGQATSNWLLCCYEKRLLILLLCYCYAHHFTETCLHHNTLDQAVALDVWNHVLARKTRGGLHQWWSWWIMFPRGQNLNVKMFILSIPSLFLTFVQNKHLNNLGVYTIKSIFEFSNNCIHCSILKILLYFKVNDLEQKKLFCCTTQCCTMANKFLDCLDIFTNLYS